MYKVTTISSGQNHDSARQIKDSSKKKFQIINNDGQGTFPAKCQSGRMMSGIRV